MAVRDHEAVVIETFNGLFRRGGDDSCPSDHFTDCNNIQFVQSGFRTRDGLETYRAIGRVVRLYTYIMQTTESLLLLNDSGDIYHAIGETTLYGPILHITGMTDFGFVSIAGRAYITPFISAVDGFGNIFQAGMLNEFVYVYKGDGTPARKAAGNPPTNGGLKAMIGYNSVNDGVITKGVHIIAVSLNGSDIGPEVYPVVIAPGDKEIQLERIPLGTSGSRTIIMTHAIDPKDYIADQNIYPFYVAQVIPDDTTESILLSIDDASLTSVFTPVGLNGATGAMWAETTDDTGFCDQGLHIIGVVYETDTGYLTAPGPEFFTLLSTVDVTKRIHVGNIPVSPDPFVTRRRLVASRAIEDYNGDEQSYQLFFIPEGEIEDNTTTTKDVSFYDGDLIDDASHLIENFSAIPAGVTLTTFHGRMVVTTPYNDISIAYLSAPGEPEAIDQVDGIIIAPLDGHPITNAQEFRDVLYIFKKTRTIAFNDNGDAPSSWGSVIMDQGIGSSVHGVGTVLDSGGVNIDFLLITDFSGIMLFDGAYQRPELSWKIKDFWFEIDRNEFHKIQVYNDSLTQTIYVLLPDGSILIGDYSNALNSKDIRWAPWTFDIAVSSISLLNINTLILASKEPIEAPDAPSDLEVD